MHPLRKVFPDQAGKVLDTRSGNPCDASVVHQQALFRLLPYTFYFPEHGLYLCLAPQVAVVRNPESVRFVPYPLQDFQSL